MSLLMLFSRGSASAYSIAGQHMFLSDLPQNLDLPFLSHGCGHLYEKKSIVLCYKSKLVFAWGRKPFSVQRKGGSHNMFYWIDVWNFLSVIFVDLRSKIPVFYH